MADNAEKDAAKKLFDAVASGTVSAPTAAPAAAPVASPAAAPPTDARALFAQLARSDATDTRSAVPKNVEPMSAEAGRLVAERSGDPRFAPAPGGTISNEPTKPQQAASPIVRGLQSIPDLANLATAGILSIPNPYEMFRSAIGKPVEKSMETRDQLLRNTGGNGVLYKYARDYGVVPPDPEWRPSGWLARALYDTTDLATQLAAAGPLSRMAAPATAFGKRDLVASGIGGLTGATAHEVAPKKYADAAESTGMALGAMSPYLMVPNIVRQGASKLYDMFRAPAPAETGRQLATQVGREPRQLLEEFTTAQPMAPSIEGWSPSPGTIMAGAAAPGERSAGTALLGVERRAADKPTAFRDPINPEEAITPVELRQRNAQALTDEMRGLGPEGLPAAATAEMEGRVQRVRDTAARRSAALEGEADLGDAAARRAQEVVDAQLPQIAPGERTQARADASQRMFGALEGAEDRASIQGGRLFDAVDPDKTARVPMYRIRDALDEVKALAVERGRTDAIPSVMRPPKDVDGVPMGDKIDDFLHSWEQQPAAPKFLAKVPYERVKGLRSRLTTAQRQAVDPQEREFFGRLISGVDNAVAESGTGQLAQNYATARDFWRDNVARPFREGPVANILRNDKSFTGAATLMAPGERGGQNMQQLAASARSDPDLYRSVVDYARADMTAFTTNVDGRVNGAKLKEWVDKHAPVLSHFPELQQEFGRIATAQRAADNYVTQAAERSPVLRALAERGIKNTEDTIRNSAARFYLNADPADVISRIQAVTGKGERRRAAEQAMSMLKTREARDGLARAYYDSIVQRALGSSERVDPKGGWKNTFTKILDNEADLAGAWLPPAVQNRMRQLDKATSMENKRQNARANDGSRTAEDTGSADAADLSVGHRLVQSLRGDLPTAIGGATAGGIAGSSMGPIGSTVGAAVGATGAYLGRHLMLARTAAREAALREAIFNPDVFERVMSSASLDPIVKKRIATAIHPYMLIANTEAAGDHARP